MKYELIAGAGIRLDKYISEKIPSLSRSYAQKLIDDGLVLVEEKRVKSSHILCEDEKIDICVPEPEPLSTQPEDIPLDILYEDSCLLVVNKPQGMVVHPAAGNYSGTLVNALLAHCGDTLSEINGVIRPGIVHRIDKDTSGLLLVAKNNAAHIELSRQLKEHMIMRRYIAIVHGNIKSDNGTVDKPIGRHPGDRKKMTVTDKNSREAVTHYNVLERLDRYTFVECTLETGRTHQIRVHMKSIGHPIVGDKTYGVKNEKLRLPGQLLHAKMLSFTNPRTAEYMEFDSGVPERFKIILGKTYEI